jgi:aminoglycoside 3-N-acetyltransferase
MRQMLVAHLPGPVIARLRSARRHGRRARFHAREAVAPVSLGRAEVAAALRAAGLRAGDGAFVHTAMSRFGKIEGGPGTVVGAFEDVLGPDGLLVMPSFPLDASTADYLAADPVFDVRSTPSRMGALTEYFRTLPGVERSLHPTHPVCARGPGAAELVAGHADAPTPFGEGTPFARMVERGTTQVWLGTTLRTFTLYHAFECLRPFPLEVFSPEPVMTRCVDAEGRERAVPTLVHDPELGSRKDETRERMRSHLREAGVLRVAQLGRGEVMAAPLPELFRELDVLLARGITIYEVEVPA